MTQRHGNGGERCAGAALAERRREHVEALVLFEPADAEQHEVVGGDAVPLPDDRALGRSGQRRTSSRSMPFGIVRICPGRGRRCRATVGSSAASVAMIGIGRARASADGPAQRRVCRCASATGSASRVAPNSSRPCGLSTSGAGTPPPARVAEHARAEAVDHVDLAGVASDAASRPARSP